MTLVAFKFLTHSSNKAGSAGLMPPDYGAASFIQAVRLLSSSSTFHFLKWYSEDSNTVLFFKSVCFK